MQSLIRVSDQVMLEFSYDENSYKIGESGLFKVENKHDDSVTIVNSSHTGNYSRYTVINTDEDNILVNENDTYHYYDEDINVSLEKSKLKDYELFKYNRVRIHILSGYNFQDSNGFNLNMFVLSEANKLINLCNYVYLKSSTTQITFNPKPIKISELIYDKYIELEILSLENLLNNIQPSDEDDKIVNELFGGRLQNKHTLNIQYESIKDTKYKNGFLTYTKLETFETVMSSIDRYNKIQAKINLSEDGSCFEYQANYMGRQIEDFIYQLNGIPGNNYYLVHDISVIEQVGMSFNESDKFSIVQKKDFGKVFKYRPVLYSKNALAVSIDYTLHLINEVDGAGIVASASITSDKVNLFREKLIKINIPDGKIKIYNRISSNSQNVIKDNISEILKTKVVATYINTAKIGTDKDEPIKIYPFRNNIKIELYKDNQISEDILVNGMKYFLVFIKNDSSKLYVPEIHSDEVKKENGELLFVIEEAQSTEIRNYKVKDCYILAKSSETESVVSKLSWNQD